jgi:uncharacterized iron-regulated membrane protein
MTAQMKSKRPRNVIFIAHRYIGLAVGILAAAIGLTGSLLIIHGWTSTLFSQSSQSISVPANGQPLPIPELIVKAKALQPNLTLESLDLPKTATDPVTAWWLAAPEQWTEASLNPYTGAMIGTPHQDSESYTSLLYNIHITLLGGDWGGYVAGLVGLLTTVLCITGIVLWPGWRKLKSGFTIKWNAHIKRLNFDLHKVAGIIAAVFLAMAMGTGFIWNYGTWTNPLIYALTFSPQPAEIEQVSKPIANQPPIAVNANLIQTASAALPPGAITSIYFPTQPDGVIRINKTIKEQEASAIVDQYSGKIIQVDNPLLKKQSLGDKITASFGPVHFGTFAGEASRILYVFVGLSPTILLITGFIMWRERKKPRKPDPAPSRELTLQ